MAAGSVLHSGPPGGHHPGLPRALGEPRRHRHGLDRQQPGREGVPTGGGGRPGPHRHPGQTRTLEAHSRLGRQGGINIPTG